MLNYNIIIVFLVFQILAIASTPEQNLNQTTLSIVGTISTAIYMLTSQNQNITIFQHNSYNHLFVDESKPLECSQNKLYVYQQTSQQYKNNTPYNIYVKNSAQVKFVINSQHQIINPTAILSKCNKTICQIIVRNGCPQLTILSYFDRIKLKIDGFQTISYDVICDQSFYYGSFTFGNMIAICLIIVCLAFLALKSKAISISGQGININLWTLTPFICFVCFCGIIRIFSLLILRIIVDIISFILGIIGMGFCCNELLYLSKLRLLLFGCKIRKINLRIMEVISLLFGLSMVFAWWFLDKNWILNDILCLCTIAATLKIMKFTSLKMATLTVVFIIMIELLFLFVLYFSSHQDQNRMLINQINGIIMLQIPTINVVYGQKCSWISIISIAYQGIVLSYLRRFDTSRNTRIYYIIGATVLSIGSLIWLLITLGSPINLPFGIITDPLTIILVFCFAYRRKESRIIWEGKFYDEQFADRQGMQKLKQSIEAQRQMVQFRSSLLQGLKLQQQSQSAKSFNPNDPKTTKN